jgi:hypothetical protein
MMSSDKKNKENGAKKEEPEIVRKIRVVLKKEQEDGETVKELK